MTRQARTLKKAVTRLNDDWRSRKLPAREVVSQGCALRDRIDVSGLSSQDKAGLTIELLGAVAWSANDIGDRTTAQSVESWCHALHAAPGLSVHQHAQIDFQRAAAIRIQIGVHEDQTLLTDEELERVALERWNQRERLREARVLYAQISKNEEVYLALRAGATDNLATTLVDSTRFVESVQWRWAATRIQPDTPSTYLNLASTCFGMIEHSTGDSDPLRVIHDWALARAHRGQADIRYLSPNAVTLLDRFTPFGDTDPDDFEAQLNSAWTVETYENFIAALGLSLNYSFAPMTTGHSQDTLATSPGLPSNVHRSAIHAIQDAYAAARRVAYTAYTLDASDGERAAHFAMAQRSALDVLEKVAVATNEALNLGRKPRDVSYQSLWLPKDGTLPTGMIAAGATARDVLPLSELAYDLSGTLGLHSEMRELRNAATHRFVWVGQPDDKWVSALPLDLRDLALATIDTLITVRSAIVQWVFFMAQLEERAAGCSTATPSIAPVDERHDHVSSDIS